METLDFYNQINNIIGWFQIEGGVKTGLMALMIATSVISALFIAISFIFTAFVSKKGRVLSFFTAAFNFMCLILMPFLVKIFHSSKFFVIITGTSQSDLNQKMIDFYLDQIPLFLVGSAMSMFMLAAFITTIISISNSMKVKPAVLGIFALIIHIARYFTATPYNLITPLFTHQTTPAAQFIAYVLYIAAYSFPAFLVLISGIISLVRNIKEANKKKLENVSINDTVKGVEG